MGKVVKKVGKAIGKVFKSVVGFVGMLFSPPKTPKASANAATEARLNVTLVPEENRKIVFGETALGTDLRFWETFGSKNERHVQVIAAAGHAIESFGNLYIDELPVPLDPFQPFPGNKYYQALTRYAVVKGGSGSGPFGSGTRWTASSTFHGCAYFVLDWVYTQEKLTNGIPSRITQIGKGAKVYDPRRDSTKGGVGLHRADNPDTWEYAPTDINGIAIGRNNALQMLTYQLGLFIRNKQTNALVLVGGRGVDPDDIDFASFVTAANYCEIYRWYSDCVLSTGDSHSTNEGILEAAASGQLVDVGGRFSYYVAADDTANAVVYLNESDIVGDIDWEPQPSLSEQFNELPGTFVDPAALFQTRPLPMAWDQAYYDQDGYKKRGGEMKLSAVQDPVQGQKLLRIALNRTRFPGVFTAPFNLKALKVQKHSLVRLSFEPFAWVNKLFRVEQQGIGDEGGIQLVLREEDASIYQPGTVVDVPPPSASYGGDRNVKIAVTDLATFATGIESGNSAVDAIRVSWTTDDQRILHTEVRFRKTGEADWQTSAPLRRDILSALISPVMPTTEYEVQVRHISLWYIPGDWVSSIRTTDAVTRNPITGELTYADGTPIENLKPSGPNANQTQAHISAGIAGQGWGATASEDAASNAKVPLGANRIINSDLGTAVPFYVSNSLPKGFLLGWGGNGSAGPQAWDICNSAGKPSLRVYFEVGTNPGNGTIFDNANNGVGASVDWLMRYGAQVEPGDKVAFSAKVAKFRASRSVALLIWYNAAGGYLGEVSSDAGGAGPDINGNTTHPSLWPTAKGVAVAPAGAAYAAITQRIETNNQPGPYGWMADPMIAVIASNQDAIPEYNPGPAERNVDKTSENTSAGIVGQGPLATQNVPIYAGMAAAIAAGLTSGQTFLDSTNGGKLTTVVINSGASSNRIEEIYSDIGKGATTPAYTYLASVNDAGKYIIEVSGIAESFSSSQTAYFNISIYVSVNGGASVAIGQTATGNATGISGPPTYVSITASHTISAGQSAVFSARVVGGGAPTSSLGVFQGTIKATKAS